MFDVKEMPVLIERVQFKGVNIVVFSVLLNCYFSALFEELTCFLILYRCMNLNLSNKCKKHEPKSISYPQNGDMILYELT